MAIWMLKQSSADIDSLARQTGVSPVLARLLAVRGYRSAEEVERFFHRGVGDIADPMLFQDMDKAVAIVKKALDEKTPCAVFGDYDADGVMSTVIMLRALRPLGLDISYYIPHRESEGYGMHNEAIAELAAQGVKLILACDNGVSALEQVEYAHSLGMEIVIFDHHELDRDEQTGAQSMPAAAAVVDAKRDDCSYPFKKYCAAAVCYRFTEAFYSALGRDWTALGRELLPFAAMATVCDIVDLVEENRWLVKDGLPAVADSDNPGIRALLEAVELTDTPLDVYHIGFIIGPCINASGRLDIADVAVDLFMSDNAEEASRLAERLVELNQQRRQLTEDGAAAALAMIEEQGMTDDKIMVLHCEDIPESVAGIIAGRVKERYHRPAIIIGGSEKELLRGSCRSVEAYNIFLGLSACREYLQGFGGHPMAAGLSIAAADIPAFRRRINELCELDQADLQHLYRIDSPLPLPLADLELARQLENFAPYGKGNEEPLFADKGLRLESLDLLGKTARVLRWHLRHPRGPRFEAIDFNGKDKLRQFLDSEYGESIFDELCQGRCAADIRLDIIYTLSVNTFNGRQSAQLRIMDFRAAE